MNNVIIGTAGHVDHGKTSLIKALTGIDTDRLKEEKKRGITIELGFAHLDFDDGTKVGIVDVPGHEKFVKNMLAGAGGIDIALLIVAANEGVMPQTVEHFEILKLLDIKKGIIVVTKTDMVEADWLNMIKEDIKNLVKGSGFENASVMEVSVYANTGIGELKTSLYNLVKQAEEKDMEKAFRIPVDRIFSIDGFGTVITGTLIEGSVNKGDSVEIYPTGTKTKVRNIQVHDLDVETAYAGQRVAINLANVKKDMLERGSVIAAPDSMINSHMIDVYLQVLPDGERVVKNNSRVHLYHGSRDVLCKVVLLDCDELKPGEKGYAQLRLEEEVSFKYGDRYIVRFYSPLETIGGGMVLNSAPNKHHRLKENVVSDLERLEKGDAAQRILVLVKEKSRQLPDVELISVIANLPVAVVENELENLDDKKQVVMLNSGHVVDISYYKGIVHKSEQELRTYHKNNAYKKGMNIEEYKSKIFKGMQDSVMAALVERLVGDKVIKQDGLFVSAFDFIIKTDDNYDKLAKEIEAIYIKAGVIVPAKDEVLGKIKDKNKNKVIESMINENRLVMVDKQLLFHKDVFDDCVNKMKDFIGENGEITLGQFRDVIGASRKYAMAILDYCDAKKVTKKIGDSRKLM